MMTTHTDEQPGAGLSKLSAFDVERLLELMRSIEGQVWDALAIVDKYEHEILWLYDTVHNMKDELDELIRELE